MVFTDDDLKTFEGACEVMGPSEREKVKALFFRLRAAEDVIRAIARRHTLNKLNVDYAVEKWLRSAGILLA